MWRNGNFFFKKNTLSLTSFLIPAGPCESLLKWKPPHLNSIDFHFSVTSLGEASAVAELLVLRSDQLVRFTDAPRSDIQVNRTSVCTVLFFILFLFFFFLENHESLLSRVRFSVKLQEEVNYF